MEIYAKLQKAREFIKSNSLKKEGKNTFSGYGYFKPTQVSELVYNACKEIGLLTKFDLIRDEFGLTGILTIFNLNESGEFIPGELQFKMATDIPEIKATNVTQQIGGAVTYTHRYLLMIAFDIVENDADFDAHDNRQKEEKKQELKEGTKNFQDCVVALNSGYTIEQIQKKYTLSQEIIKKLTDETI